MGPIAVFDSGVGGLSVLRELVAQMPSEHFLYFGDSANAPYGTRPTAEIRSLTLAHAERLFDRGAKALVVACNTATSAAIGELRARWPDRVIIGIEPALKLAVSRHPGGCIGVLATEATLREEKFAALLQRCAENCHILKCPCPELVEFVERGELTGPALERCLAARLAPGLHPLSLRRRSHPPCGGAGRRAAGRQRGHGARDKAPPAGRGAAGAAGRGQRDDRKQPGFPRHSGAVAAAAARADLPLSLIHI